MRTLWNIVSFLAAVHLLAIGLFIGWLWQSGRLDGDRVQTLRTTLAQTISDAEEAAADAEAQAEAERTAAEEEARMNNPPVTSAAQIELMSALTNQADMSIRRIADEAAQRHDDLSVREAALQEAIDDFEAEKAAWEASVEAERAQRTDDQFAKAVKDLESLPPKQAKQRIMELVGTGRMDQAVAYMNAMSARARGKLQGAFKTDVENQLATELLEALRTYGVDDAGVEVSGNADTASPNSEPAATTG